MEQAGFAFNGFFENGTCAGSFLTQNQCYIYFLHAVLLKNQSISHRLLSVREERWSLMPQLLRIVDRRCSPDGSLDDDVLAVLAGRRRCAVLVQTSAWRYHAREQELEDASVQSLGRRRGWQCRGSEAG